HAALYKRVITPELLHQDRPIDYRRRLLVCAIVVNIADHADDLAPVILHAFADALAGRGAGISPHFARQVFRYDDVFSLFVNVGPAVIAPGDQRCSDGLEETRRDELEAAQRRKLAFGIIAVFSIQQVSTVVAVIGYGVGERRRSHARNRG